MNKKHQLEFRNRKDDKEKGDKLYVVIILFILVRLMQTI